MTVVKTVAAHEIVASVYPRTVTERDEIGMAVGKAIDDALALASHDFRVGRRSTTSSLRRWAEERLDEELADADLPLTAEQRTEELRKVLGVLTAFRGSELRGRLRPKSRLVLVGETAGFYAQPDYWNGTDRFYEMKSFRVPPIPPSVALQVGLFQLAFPGFRAILASFDRHASPVVSLFTEVPALAPPEAARLLRLAGELAREKGQEKVLEYIDNPVIRYSVQGEPAGVSPGG